MSGGRFVILLLLSGPERPDLAAGAGIKITPVAFLVIRGENVRMLPVAEPASTSVDRLIELLPDLLEKGEAYFAEKKAAKEAEKAAEEA